jgi:hypothetical protein
MWRLINSDSTVTLLQSTNILKKAKVEAIFSPKRQFFINPNSLLLQKTSIIVTAVKTLVVVLRPHSRERRRGITAHNSISDSVYRRIITG